MSPELPPALDADYVGEAVPFKKAQALDNELNCKVFEVSFSTGHNVNELFESIVSDVLKIFKLLFNR